MDQPDYTRLPPDIFNEVIAGYGDLEEIIARRRLNRATYQRYLDARRYFLLSTDVLDQAATTNDSEVLDDWLTVNQRTFGTPITGNLSLGDFVLSALVQARSPDLDRVVASNVPFMTWLGEELVRVLTPITGPQRVGFGLMLSTRALNLLSLLVECSPMIVDQVLLPWLLLDPSYPDRLLTALAFMQAGDIFYRVVAYIEQHNVPIKPGRITALRRTLKYRPR